MADSAASCCSSSRPRATGSTTSAPRRGGSACRSSSGATAATRSRTSSARSRTSSRSTTGGPRARPSRSRRRRARRPIRGIVPASDPTAVIAALAAERLGLPHNPPAAARRAANKLAMRDGAPRRGRAGPARSGSFPVDGDPSAAGRAEVGVPVRPEAAHLLGEPRRHPRRRSGRRSSPPGGASRSSSTTPPPSGARARRTAPGRSWSRPSSPARRSRVEGLLRGGRLEVLAVFDKPDPLDGPFFEETIYVTPVAPPARRSSPRVEAVDRRGRRARSGSSRGRSTPSCASRPDGPVVLEIAARSIGGLCSRTLRFGAGLSLEEVLVAHAMGLPLDAAPPRGARLRRDDAPHPAPRRAARRPRRRGARGPSPGVEDVVITVPEGREVVPLPEGDSYLGFLFAHGETPAAVEARAARGARAARRSTSGRRCRRCERPPVGSPGSLARARQPSDRPK